PRSLATPSGAPAPSTRSGSASTRSATRMWPAWTRCRCWTPGCGWRAWTSPSTGRPGPGCPSRRCCGFRDEPLVGRARGRAHRPDRRRPPAAPAGHRGDPDRGGVAVLAALAAPRLVVRVAGQPAAAVAEPAALALADLAAPASRRGRDGPHAGGAG